MKRLSVLALAAVLLVLGPAACSLRGRATVPLPVAATRALAEARELMRQRPDDWEGRALAALERASLAAPEWLAPLRFADDLEREALLGHQALARRRAALEDGASATELYLAGRLEGRAGAARIERAARLDPELAWAWHGTAWNRFLEGDVRAALRPGRRALGLARGSHELGVFAAAEARYLAALGREEQARERLEEILARPEVHEPARTELEVALARLELGGEEREGNERGYWRALALFESGHLTASEHDRLGDALLARRARIGRPDLLSELYAALVRGDALHSARLRARILGIEGAHALAAAAWERSESPFSSPAYQRVRDLERGAAATALERWRADLPGRLRDADGLPLEESLRVLVLAARSVSEPGGGVRFGQALIAAGWFDEAAGWASALATDQPQAALDLRARAAEGRALLSGIRGLLGALDVGREAFVARARGVRAEPRELGDLDELLAGMQALFEGYSGAPLLHSLESSPRIGYGGLASIVHPGPRFSALDEAAGRGREGAAVPGLAAELALIGRFGIFGQAPGGGGPDGSILRLVGGEWRSGEHLGVPFAGYVAWCEGADLESRPGRSGSRISGAALHEGYWVDIETVRQDLQRIALLERTFLGAERGPLERALAGDGPRVSPGAGRGERARWLAPLGEGERMLLAVLAERPAPTSPEMSRVSLDEVLDLTARHEEGHLTDRSRFLPLRRHWLRVLGLLFRHGFSPRAVSRALEYRAQLVALCVADEPRMALADCLSAAGGGGGAVLPHGEAYRDLVGDLLRVAADELERLPALDPERYLIYQLHRLSGAEVRSLALLVARERGMLED